MSQSIARRIFVFSPAFRAQLQQRLPQLQQRVAPFSSTIGRSAAPKGRVLEKPDKFRPPSHPQKLRKAAPVIRQYGPSLTPEERAAQRKKKYPNMMPPEGSFMYWFLTNRMIHLWITLSVLAVCGFYSISLNFKQNSPYYDMLPPMGEYIFHPFASIRQFGHVYKLHTEYTSEKTAAKRKIEVEEAQKRRAYRVAHGLEFRDGPGLTPTTLNEGNQEPAVGADGQAVAEAQRTDEVRGPQRYKKWFGIW